MGDVVRCPAPWGVVIGAPSLGGTLRARTLQATPLGLPGSLIVGKDNSEVAEQSREDLAPRRRTRVCGNVPSAGQTVVRITQWFPSAGRAQPGLLVETATYVVEELGRIFCPATALRITLHHPTARLCDQVEGPTEGAPATPFRR